MEESDADTGEKELRTQDSVKASALPEEFLAPVPKARRRILCARRSGLWPAHT